MTEYRPWPYICDCNLELPSYPPYYHHHQLHCWCLFTSLQDSLCAHTFNSDKNISQAKVLDLRVGWKILCRWCKGISISLRGFQGFQ